MSDLKVLFLFYMIEGALVGYVGMALIGVRLNLRQFIIVGVCQGLMVYLVRGIYTINNIPFGTHSFFVLASLIIILYFVTRQSWGICTVAGLLGFITVVLSEILIIPLLFSYLKLTIDKSVADTWRHIFMGYVGDWLLIFMAMVLFFSKKSVVNLGNLQK